MARRLRELRALRALRLVHPFPSLLNAALVGALAYVARPDLQASLLLSGGMLGMQFCIGTVNDLVDRAADATVKPWKPIPAGTVSIPAARAVTFLTGLAGLVLAAAAGPVSAALWLAMLACGLLYDLWLKPTAVAWACFSVAFMILPIYAWHGASGSLPPRPEFLLPLAFVAGPAINLANGLVDLEADQLSGVPTLATRLGRHRTILVLAILLLAIHAVAWATIGQGGGSANPAVLAATPSAAAGLYLLARPSVPARAAGWSLQAVAMGLLALGWLAAVTAPA